MSSTRSDADELLDAYERILGNAWTVQFSRIWLHGSGPDSWKVSIKNQFESDKLGESVNISSGGRTLREAMERALGDVAKRRMKDR